MSNKYFFISLIVLALAITSSLIVCLPKSPNLPTTEAVFSNDVSVILEIAQDKEDLAKGLSKRKSLPQNQGMLFVFEEEQFLAFWMKDTLIPLDMIFLNANKEIVKIVESAEPCLENECPSYFSDVESKYVIELNGGFCEQNNISTTTLVSF